MAAHPPGADVKGVSRTPSSAGRFTRAAARCLRAQRQSLAPRTPQCVMPLPQNGALLGRTQDVVCVAQPGRVMCAWRPSAISNPRNRDSSNPGNPDSPDPRDAGSFLPPPPPWAGDLLFPCPASDRATRMLERPQPRHKDPKATCRPTDKGLRGRTRGTELFSGQP